MAGHRGRSEVPSTVFINCPFDARYEPLFVAMIAGLVALGRDPHCVLEVVESGQGRLQRIFELMRSCDASIHDLSRIGLSGGVPRFNMPFELGLAWSIAQYRPHRFYVFESRPYRLQRSLSDLNGTDPQLHTETQRGILHAVLNCLGTPSGAPHFSDLARINRLVQRLVPRVKERSGATSVFTTAGFRLLVGAATDIARNEIAIA